MGKYFSTLLPPPNLTGILHLGHMWNAILQDALVRFYSSKGIETYWGFGLDHAGISLQAKVEFELKKRGLNKLCIGQEAFQKELWNWKNKHSEIIREQYKQLGYVLPFQDERFTLDEGSVNNSLDAFRKLYKDGLIYRSEKLINWDPLLKTAISDIEIVYKKENINLYFLKYFVEGADDYLTVATTRPETIFGDTAVFVNPEDERYSKYIGKMVVIPIVNRKVKVLADDYVDMEFGTGVMKCTPAHDFQDYDLGVKHNLEFIKIFDQDLRISIEGNYFGLHRDSCREKLVENLGDSDLLLRTESYETNVSYSDRSGSKIEPMLSNQWFVKSSILSKQALDFWRSHRQDLIVCKESQSKILESMFEKMEDWCISRQLEWGIKIPVWINESGDHSLEKMEGYEESTDVLDTWFSSSLWPLTVFENKKNLFPLSVLISGKDILLFWISRMIFMCVYLKKSFPFQKVFLHGLVLDSKRKKMSKSLNNGIDPLSLIGEFGNDVVRLFFLSNTNQDANIAFSKDKLSYYSKFLHKLRNAYSFLKSQNIDLKNESFNGGNLNIVEKWIYKKLCDLVTSVNRLFGEYKFSFLSVDIVNFVWDCFCNKYLEFFKMMKSEKGMVKNTDGFISFVWNEILYLLRPLVPDYSEETYRDIYGEDMPVERRELLDSPQAVDMDWFFEYINIYESIRKNLNIERGLNVNVNLVTSSNYSYEDLRPYFSLLGHHINMNKERSSSKTLMFSVPGRDLIVEMMMEDFIVDKYMKFIGEKKKWLLGEIEFLTNRLNVGDFSKRAPQDLIDEVVEKIENYKKELKFYP